MHVLPSDGIDGLPDLPEECVDVGTLKKDPAEDGEEGMFLRWYLVGPVFSLRPRQDNYKAITHLQPRRMETITAPTRRHRQRLPMGLSLQTAPLRL